MKAVNSYTHTPQERKQGLSSTALQTIMIFQQNGNGAGKIAGIAEHGHGLFSLNTVSINDPLPPVIDDPTRYLPTAIEADLVLNFLKHPDLSHDLASFCSRRAIPVVAPGKRFTMPGVFTPIT
ncbi:MAG: hypothetical protein JXD19_02545 [Deltaproteobacteria bacterium]|nr:hypothetical protein [Deltaproteobacteria bacterium]